MFLIAVPVLKCILFWGGATDHGEGRLKIDLILMLCGFLVMGDAGGIWARVIV